jgi:uncharacterized damage-inducible protein DinB
MPPVLSFDELRAYNEEERAKWDAWFQRHDHSVFDLPLQSGAGGTFSTVWSLVDHIMNVEKRHLQRLRSEYPLPETTGVPAGEWAAIYAFAHAVRAELIATVEALSDVDVPRPMQILGTTRMVTPRKILFHVLLHEARHWAQISLALRNAGLEPPPDQDLVFSSALG